MSEITLEEFLENTPKYQLLSQAKAKAICKEAGVTFKAFKTGDEGDAELESFIQKNGGKVSEGLLLKSSGIITPRKSCKQGAIWFRLSFDKYVIASTLFKEVGHLLDYNAVTRSIEDTDGELIPATYPDYLKHLSAHFGPQIAQDYFQASAWARAGVLAIYLEMDAKEEFVKAILEHMEYIFETSKAPIVKRAYRIIDGRKEDLVESMKSLNMTCEQALLYYDAAVEPELLKYAIRISNVSEESITDNILKLES